MTITLILGFIFVLINTLDVWSLRILADKLGPDRVMLLRGLGSAFLSVFFLLPFVRILSLHGLIILIAVAFYGVLCTHISLLGMTKCNVVISEMLIKISFVINIIVDIMAGYVKYNINIILGGAVLVFALIFLVDVKGKYIERKTLIYPVAGFFMFGFQPYFIRYGFEENLYNTEAYVLVFMVILVIYYLMKVGAGKINLNKSDIKYTGILGLIFAVAMLLQSLGSTICIPSIFRGITVLALGLIYIVGLINMREKLTFSKAVGVVLSVVGVGILSVL